MKIFDEKEAVKLFDKYLDYDHVAINRSGAVWMHNKKPKIVENSGFWAVGGECAVFVAIYQPTEMICFDRDDFNRQWGESF